MAIVLPLLLALLIAIFEFGRAWNIREVLTNAAREGARVGVIQGVDADSVTSVINTRLEAAGLSPDDVDSTIEGVDGETGTTTTVTLSHDYTFRFIGPVVGLMTGGETGVPGTITLSTASIMRNE